MGVKARSWLGWQVPIQTSADVGVTWTVQFIGSMQAWASNGIS